jgi:hypothetical protein
MKTIDKPLTRKTRNNFLHYRKPIVVTVFPGDYLELRLHRERKRVVVFNLHELYFEGVKRAVAAAKAAKKKKRAKK